MRHATVEHSEAFLSEPQERTIEACTGKSHENFTLRAFTRARYCLKWIISGPAGFGRGLRMTLESWAQKMPVSYPGTEAKENDGARWSAQPYPEKSFTAPARLLASSALKANEPER